MDFKGFTNQPVDFDAVLGAASACWKGPRLTPFFHYYNTSHAEGPRKWYIYACPGDEVKVYLPAKGVLYDRGIRATASEQGKDGHFNGEKVLLNIQAWFDVSPEITVFYMHLTLRDEIKAMVQDSPNGYVIFDAGTHIGYMYDWPSPNPYHSLDFGVEDRGIDTGLTQNPKHFLNTRTNPLDYFTDDVRESILEAYQATYDTLVKGGVTPYSDLEDSRANFNEQNKIWGLWIKDDLPTMWDGSAWSIVSLVKKADLHQATYWKSLEDFPTMSGLFVEQSRAPVVGKPLYEGQPLRRSKFHILSGNDSVGVARIAEERGNDPRVIYLKYEVQPNTAGKFDEMLMMESFQTLEAAEASDFSDNAVSFRRKPCKDDNPDCY